MSGGASSGRSSWRARRLAVPGLEWAYANHARAAVLFLGISSGMLVVGIVAVVAFGTEAVVAASSLLTIAIFVLMFTVLVFVTRVATRGAVSFSIYSRRSIDEGSRRCSTLWRTKARTCKSNGSGAGRRCRRAS